MPTIKFAIASNKEFAKTTLPKCINSLKAAGVPPWDIHVFTGGYLKGEFTWHIPGEPYEHRGDWDVMDYNAFLGALETNLDTDYWFMMQDTCWVGKGFYEAIKGLKIDSPAVALCKEGKSMNIGLYSTKYLKANEFFIESHKAFQDKGELKKYMVMTEDALLDSFRESSYLCVEPPTSTGPTDLYGNGIPRMVVYYKEIDFYKSKANWEPKEQYELGL